MRIRQFLIATVLVLFLFTSKLWATPKIRELIEKMDEIEALETDITVKIKLIETRVRLGVDIVEGVYYRRDQNDAYLIVITDPNESKGNGYLRVGDTMWMYRRNTRTFQLMARGQSVEGTDVNVGDLEARKYVDLYEAVVDEQGNESISEETLGKAKIPVYRFEVRAKVKNVAYPKKVFWIRRDNFLKLKEQSFSLSGTLLRTNYYPKYTQIKGRYIPVKELAIDEFEIEKGNKTLLELSGISLEPIDDAVFTKAYLENLSK